MNSFTLPEEQVVERQEVTKDLSLGKQELDLSFHTHSATFRQSEQVAFVMQTSSRNII